MSEESALIEAAPKPKKRFKWVKWGLVALLLITLTAIAIPNFMKARTTSCKSACINNLRQIDGAKEQWALENKASEGTPVTAADEEAINKFIKGEQRPVCPSGDASARYIYNAVGAAPSCTVNTNVSSGHSL